MLSQELARLDNEEAYDKELGEMSATHGKKDVLEKLGLDMKVLGNWTD